MDCPGLYFQLNPESVFFVFECHNLLADYRDTVVIPQMGAALKMTIKMVMENKAFQFSKKYYKKYHADMRIRFPKVTYCFIMG